MRNPLLVCLIAMWGSFVASGRPLWCQSTAIDSLRRAQFEVLEGRADQAAAKLEGLLGGQLDAVASLYLGAIQLRFRGNVDSAEVLARRTFDRDFLLDIEPHRDYFGEEYQRLLQRVRDDIAARFPASVTVAAHPWANVTIDGSELGATPVREFRLAPGRHVVQISRSGYLRYEETLLLQPGGSALVGPIGLQARTDTMVLLERPLRDFLVDRFPWAQRSVLALDSGDTRTAGSLLGQEPEAAGDAKAAWHAVYGIVLALQGATDQAALMFEEAIGQSPSIAIGLDDLNPSVATLFTTAKDRALPTATLVSLGPGEITVNRDLLWLRIRTRRSERISARLRDGITGRVVWQDDRPADTGEAIPWDGKAAADGTLGPLASGRYELVVTPIGRRGLVGSGFSTWLNIRTAMPDTSRHVGEIPDSLLMPETRGTGARVGSVLQGLLFGAAVIGLAVAADAGWGGSEIEDHDGPRTLGISVAALGVLGAALLDTRKPVRDRVKRNDLARARWDAQRQQVVQMNAARLSQPYLMTVEVIQ